VQKTSGEAHALTRQPITMFSPRRHSVGSEKMADHTNDAAVESATSSNWRLMDIRNIRIIPSISKDPFEANPEVDQDLGHLGC